MRVREFRYAVETEFGDRGASLLQDLILGEVGSRSAEEALAAGVPAEAVWVALCRATDVPPNRWHGVGLRDPQR